MTPGPLTAAQRRQLAVIRRELSRLIRYDDESVVHEEWIRQRYDGGYAATYRPARTAAVVTAWHEAGHVVAALAVGARFSSASIRQGSSGQGRVHAIRGGGADAFVIDAAGQIAERLRRWTMLERDDELRRWLTTWRGDGGDAKHFRAAISTDELTAWRRAEQVLTPRRLQIRHIARALLVRPGHLPYAVAEALYQEGNPASESSTTSAPAS
jgi:Peptidase M50B-like